MGPATGFRVEGFKFSCSQRLEHIARNSEETVPTLRCTRQDAIAIVILLLFALHFHNNDASTVTICVVGTALGPKYIVDTYPALTRKPYTLQRHTDHMGKLKLSNPSCSYLKPRGSIYTTIRELGPTIQYYSRN